VVDYSHFKSYNNLYRTLAVLEYPLRTQSCGTFSYTEPYFWLSCGNHVLAKRLIVRASCQFYSVRAIFS